MKNLKAWGGHMLSPDCLKVPINKVDAYQKSILSKCKLLRPAYMPIVEVVDYENKKFIVLWCPGGDNRPYIEFSGAGSIGHNRRIEVLSSVKSLL